MTSPEAPESFAGLAIEGVLGAGAYGTVFLARRPDGSPVALKRLDALGNPTARTRFQREASVGASLVHPNLVRILDWGEDGGLPYLVMEFLEGVTMDVVIRGAPGRPPAEVIPFAEQLCAGVEALHGAGLVHRDLKPQNVMVGRGGEVRIMDLGLMKIEQGEALTATGAMVGSPLFMAPEQLAGKASRRSDIFALALLLHMLVSGRHPFGFRAGDDLVTFYNRLRKQPPERCGRGEALDRFFRQALDPDPMCRPESPGELLKGFRAAVEQVGGGASADREPPTEVLRLPEEGGRGGWLPGALRRRFRVGRLLGKGGMGSVFEATMPETDRPCALKVMSEGGAPQERQRFLREARMMASLRSPRLVEVFDQGETEGVLWIAMERIRGETLASLGRRNKLAPGDSARLILEVAAGLETLHGAGAVHRDVKPDNVMVEPGGRVVLMDLGLAMVSGVTRLTATGQLMGTLAYLPPEVVMAGTQSPAGDWYALGVTFYALLERRLPYSVPELLAHIGPRGEALPALGFEAATPGEEAAVRALMSADPGARPDCAGALEGLLGDSGAPARTAAFRPVSDTGVQAAPPGAEPPGATRRWLGGVLLGVAMVLGSALVARSLLLPSGPPPLPLEEPRVSALAQALADGEQPGPLEAALEELDAALGEQSTPEAAVGRVELWARLAEAFPGEAGDRARYRCLELARSALGQERDPRLRLRLLLAAVVGLGAGGPPGVREGFEEQLAVEVEQLPAGPERDRWALHQADRISGGVRFPEGTVAPRLPVPLSQPGSWGADPAHGPPLLASLTAPRLDLGAHFRGGPGAALAALSRRARLEGRVLDPPPGWVVEVLLPQLLAASGELLELLPLHPELLLMAEPGMLRDRQHERLLEVVRRVDGKVAGLVPGAHRRRWAWRAPWSRFQVLVVNMEMAYGDKARGLRRAREVLEAVADAPGPWALEEAWLVQNLWRRLMYFLDEEGACPRITRELVRTRLHFLEAASASAPEGSVFRLGEGDRDQLVRMFFDWFHALATRDPGWDHAPHLQSMREVFSMGDRSYIAGIADLDFSIPVKMLHLDQEAGDEACPAGVPEPGRALPDSAFPRAGLSLDQRLEELLPAFAAP